MMLKKTLLIAVCTSALLACEPEPPGIHNPATTEPAESAFQAEREPEEESRPEIDTEPIPTPEPVPLEEGNFASAETAPGVGVDQAPSGDDVAKVEENRAPTRRVPKNTFESSDGFESRMKTAMSAEAGELQVSRGASGMAFRGPGAGKESKGFGRIQGMGKVASQRGLGVASRYRAHAGATPTVSGSEANSEEYTNHGVNKFVDASEDAKLTFAIDVDTGSYTIARRKLQGGALPPKAAVRVEEFVNYFDYSYRPPPTATPSPSTSKRRRRRWPACRYELDLAAPIGDLPDKIATVRVRNKTPRGSKAVERAFSLKRDEMKTKLTQTSKDYQFAAAVVAFAEKLRQSPYAKDLSYDLIEEIAAAATRDKSQRKEFVKLVRAAKKAS